MQSRGRTDGGGRGVGGLLCRDKKGARIDTNQHAIFRLLQSVTRFVVLHELASEVDVPARNAFKPFSRALDARRLLGYSSFILFTRLWKYRLFGYSLVVLEACAVSSLQRSSC